MPASAIASATPSHGLALIGTQFWRFIGMTFCVQFVVVPAKAGTQWRTTKTRYSHFRAEQRSLLNDIIHFSRHSPTGIRTPLPSASVGGIFGSHALSCNKERILKQVKRIHRLRTLAARNDADAGLRPAGANFATFAIEQIYSNANGTIQFVVMHETQGLANGNLWAGAR